MTSQSPIFRLPIELVQYIATFLSDDDLCAFARTCMCFAAQVLPANSSVWRRKFQDQYDSIQHYTSTQLKVEYQTRALVLSQEVSFRHGEREKEYLWLEVLQTMLQETLHFTSSAASLQSPTRNVDKITEVCRHTEFLSRPITGYGNQRVLEPSDLYCAIQLCLTHLSLNTAYNRPCSRDDYNIECVYSYNSLFHIPLVAEGKVDLKTLLHIRNFWQRHFTSTSEDTFFQLYRSIGERPDTWVSPFWQPGALRCSWVGFYSCIHPYPRRARTLKKHQTCADYGIHVDEVCSNSLILEMDDNPQNWPRIANQIIPMSENTPARQKFFRGITKYDNHSHNYSTENTPYLVRGFFESVTDTQGGIPGWYRVCFITYLANRDVLAVYASEDDKFPPGNQHQQGRWQEQTVSLSFPGEDWPPVDFEHSFHCIYAYEGVVLPGGRIMLGQWLDVKEEGLMDCSRGPFFFWDA